MPMPKLKTRSGAKKRFQVKKTKAVKHARAYAKHLMTHGKDMDQKRGNRGTVLLQRQDGKKVVKELFPYGAN